MANSPSNQSVDLEKADGFEKLPSSEREVLENQVRVSTLKISYWSLYRHATGENIPIIAVSTLASVVSGAVPPLMTVVFGNFTGNLTTYSTRSGATSNYDQDLHRYTLYFVYLAIGMFVATSVSILGFSITGERMTQLIREKYLRAILRQNIAFFDNVGAGEVTTRITADMNLVQDGISQKVGLTIGGISGFVAALIVGFVRSWRLTLIVLSSVVAIIVTMGGMGKMMKKFQAKYFEESSPANTLAEETISSMKVVTAFNVQSKLAKNYGKHLHIAAAFDFKSKAALGLIVAIMMCLLNLQYALTFWQGSRFLAHGDITTAQILTVLLASVIAGVSFGNIAPHLGAIGNAIAAGGKIFATIQRQSAIDPESEIGARLEHINGEIDFANVKHIYPSRPDAVILDNFNLRILPGKITAIVGASGSGKSTVVGLIERFYEPVSGTISIDGRDIRTLNLRWLRQNISMVGQEPILFNTSIYNNIEFGLIGTVHENASAEVKARLIENAARTANAYKFITELPQGFQTNVGEYGSRISGGEKQRIAIARAVVSDPTILLLDEATAALDTMSEHLVQKALDAASKGRTTVVIAHRLSTIKYADNIAVMAKGQVVEQGTHQQLLDQNGLYSSLVRAQQVRENETAEHQISQDGEKSSAEEDLEVVGNFLTEPGASTTTTFLGGSETQISTLGLIKFMLSMNKNEQRVLIVGLLAAFMAGAGYPIIAIFFGNSIIALVDPSGSNGGHDINFWAGMFLMLAFIMLFFYTLQGTAFAFASSRLIQRARDQAFRAILRQDMAFFDRDDVNSGALTAFLSRETNRLAGISGATLGAVLNMVATICVAIVVACSFGWKLALVCTSTMPILLLCGFFRFWILSKLEARTKRTTDAAAFACEATSTIRTVASLTLERHISKEYHEKLQTQALKNLCYNFVSSLIYAFSQSFMLLAMALAFWYGGTLVLHYEYDVKQVFVCLIAILWGSQAAGGIFSHAPDIGDARSAVRKLKMLLETVPAIDSWSTKGKGLQELRGQIELRDVSFAYPSRVTYSALKNINITAQPGQFIAIVGESGSGKSTVTALLERFYDVSSGTVLVDGLDIREYSLHDYRSQLALVSQDSNLFTGTIRENIVADREDEVDEDAIIKVCEDARIYEFISSLPDGLSTYVGPKGSLLSGGQKQRLAIARALLRNPKILLLDEATSSLDSASEQLVQTALDQAAKGRTTIAIAHRLSTIRNADCIFVLDRGRVVEKGTHEELVERRQWYWGLLTAGNSRDVN